MLEYFLKKIHYDHSLLLDFLISGETNFLSFLIHYLHYVLSSWNQNRVKFLQNEELCSVFVKFRLAVEKLQQKQMFPFNVQPLVERLNQLEEYIDKDES